MQEGVEGNAFLATHPSHWAVCFYMALRRSRVAPALSKTAS